MKWLGKKIIEKIKKDKNKKIINEIKREHYQNEDKNKRHDIGRRKTRKKRKSPLYANRYCGIASKKGVRMSMYGTFNLFATILVAVV